MNRTLKLAVAQINPLVGAVADNADLVVREAHKARDEHGVDLIVFPELTLTGYPPEDLLFHAGLRKRVAAAAERVREASVGIGIVVGYPYFAAEREIYNAASLFHDGSTLTTYFKQELPNYGVFDEKRYFKEGRDAVCVDFKGVDVSLTICEDIWFPGPCRAACNAGAKLILNLNASPFATAKQTEREAVICERVAECGVPILYVNLVGGQDELVFDGGSVIIDGDGQVVYRAPAFRECCEVVEVGVPGGTPLAAAIAPRLERVTAVYEALVLGTRDYVNKHGFPGVVIGLSGGIDSALTLAIAVDALGAERVQVVLMPSRYTADISVEDAREQARLLGVGHHTIPIEPMFAATLDSLAKIFAGLPEDATEENIQARCRGIILMAISNKTGRMVLTTGNKSEMAVGYATLYGDMAGGFAPIKDCSKTMVYRLARHRNEQSRAIPERVITRPPSAELRADQKDTDSLPPYDVLDPILKMFIESDLSVEEITAAGFDHDLVVRVLNMIKRAEYKRRQAPPGVRVSRRAFGRDWRYPITSGY